MDIIEKPKDWITQICEIPIRESLNFPHESAKGIRSMISGKVKDRALEKIFRTKTDTVNEPLTGKAKKVITVIRVA